MDGAITELLLDWHSGDDEALGKLTPLIYDDLRRMAAQRFRRERHNHTMQPTVLVHEAYLQLARAQGVGWENRSHFFGIASRVMQQILIQSARARNAAKRGNGQRAELDDEPVAQCESQEWLDVARALAELASEDSRKAAVVDLRYFGGLTTEEIAEQLEVSPSTVERDMRLGLAWLHRYLA
jgi:RNA polymerase sigma factor (TIGR02999 family)